VGLLAAWLQWEHEPSAAAVSPQAKLSVHGQERLNEVARQLNEQRRKTLGYETPADRFQPGGASII
jgi:IS30 family transposase